MAHKKYHYCTVARGETKGIFDGWEKCRNQVDHYKGNLYKGFYALEDAVSYAEEHMDQEEEVVVEIQGIRKKALVKDLCAGRTA